MLLPRTGLRRALRCGQGEQHLRLTLPQSLHPFPIAQRAGWSSPCTADTGLAQNNLNQMLELNIKEVQQLGKTSTPRSGAKTVNGPPPSPMADLLKALAARFVRVMGTSPLLHGLDMGHCVTW